MFFFGSQNFDKKRMNNSKSKYSKKSQISFKFFFCITTLSAICCAIYWQDYIKIKYGSKSESKDVTSYVTQETMAVYESNIINNEEEEKLYKLGYQQHNFNKFASDKIDASRPIPDSRDAKCKKRDYNTTSLPTVSVVISFINEAFSALVRTVHSVINRTPDHLLSEIILIDDYSTLDELKAPLDEYIKKHFTKVFIHRNTQRLGVIASRVHGSRRTRGQVLMFLDSHCEVNIGWIEPLLARIRHNRQTVVSPMLDTIDKDTMLYKPSPIFLSGFNWDLSIRWEPLTPELERNITAQSYPIQSPGTTGGIFAIHGEFFRKLGEFDLNLQLWGAENIEISLKAWQCGGRIELIPCSRVGHIFRSPRAGDSSLTTYLQNQERVATVWMDEYKKYYFMSRKGANTVNETHVADRTSLRQRLGCRSFKWYLENVYPEQKLPTDPDYESHNSERRRRREKIMFDKLHTLSIRKGKIYHPASGLCLKYDPQLDKALFTVKQHKCTYNESSVLDIWSESNKNDIRFHSTDFCVTTPSNMTLVAKCNFSKDQIMIWRKQNDTLQLYNPGSGKCLKPITNDEGSYLHLVYCKDSEDLNFKFINMNAARLLK